MKKWIIIICTFLILISFFILIGFPSIQLQGDSVIEIDYGTSFIDPGVKASFLGKDISDKIQVSNSVQEELGTYIVRYQVTGLFSKTVTRKVVVVDKESPTITLLGNSDITLCPTFDYIEEGYQAKDNHDGNITDKVVITKYDDKIVYEVQDQSLNKTSIDRILHYLDNEKPTVSLKGQETVYVLKNQSYQELGVVVKDNCSANLEVVTEGKVDTTKVGEYFLTYKVKDESNNENSITRKVIVYEQNPADSKGVIYLTFDDGPNIGTTDKILDILKANNVKATFFVTGQSTSSDYLIKREVLEGHTIGLHTYTHNYKKIYTSTDAFFEDLDKIKNKVQNITGIESHIIRFAGGSSNTVSKNYNVGIMSKLVTLVIEKGYLYYDWNVSGADTSCKSSSCIYQHVINGLSKNRANYVLMHDTKSYTVGALEDIIHYGQANGYVFKPITEQTPMWTHGVNN